MIIENLFYSFRLPEYVGLKRHTPLHGFGAELSSELKKKNKADFKLVWTFKYGKYSAEWQQLFVIWQENTTVSFVIYSIRTQREPIRYAYSLMCWFIIN